MVMIGLSFASAASIMKFTRSGCFSQSAGNTKTASLALIPERSTSFATRGRTVDAVTQAIDRAVGWRPELCYGGALDATAAAD